MIQLAFLHFLRGSLFSIILGFNIATYGAELSPKSKLERYSVNELTNIKYKKIDFLSYNFTDLIVGKRLDNFNLVYNCNQYNKEYIYKKAREFLAKNRHYFKNMNLVFKCEDGPSKAKLRPWMMSFDNEDSSKGRHPSSINKKDSFLFPAIGYSSIDYSEGSNIHTSFTNIFTAVDFRKNIFPPRWHIDAGIKYGVSSSKSSINESEARLLDIDLRVGYSFPILKEPWRFTLFAGGYYTQMFVTDDRFGYKGTYYPQLYPELRRLLNSGDAISIYLKYVLTGKDLFSFASNERAVTIGGRYYTDFEGLNTFIGANYSDLGFTSDDRNTQVNLIQYNLSLGVAF